MTESRMPATTVITLRPAPMTSLLASAQRITSKHLSERTGFGKAESWQDDAWEMYDLVGEQRFLATTLAGRMAQARLFVGRLSEDPMDPPEPVDDPDDIAVQAFSYFGGTPQHLAQMIARLGINLFVPGDGWLVGIPKHMLPDSEATDLEVDPLQALEDLDWRALSVSEVTYRGGLLQLRLGEGKDELISATPEDLILVRVWRSHPRRWWQADSPTRSSLPVLRELVGLTMHISAQVDSRLAGAGVFIVPMSAKQAIAAAAHIDPDADHDPFTEALMEAMLTPIGDRTNASALVPLVVTVPDDSADKFRHITFSSSLDSEARNLRDEAIRRLALGQDAPPELLLGTAGMNHWGAWLVREDVVTTHLEPPLALICDAITTQYLHPVLMQQGMAEDEARDYVVWYDVSQMIMRPNRLADATILHDKGVISDEALRDAGGFSEADAPPDLNQAVEIAVEMAKNNPALVDNMPEIIAAFDAVLNKPATTTAGIEAPVEGEDVTTPTAGAEVGTPPQGEGAPQQTINEVSLPAETASAAPEDCEHLAVTRGVLDGQPIWTCTDCAEQFVSAAGLGDEVIPGFPYLRKPVT